MTAEVCPICGGSSWVRENLVVINDPMTGETHPVIVDRYAAGDWACEGCGWTLARPAVEADVLDGVMERATHRAPTPPRTRAPRP